MYQNCSVEGVQILLVEDNELNMEIAEFLLKEEKIESVPPVGHRKVGSQSWISK